MAKAKRYNKGKLEYNLIPHYPIQKLAEVYTKGAHKYSVYKGKDGKIYKGSEIKIEDTQGMEIIESGANNWKLGQEWSKTMASVERHIAEWKAGKDVDDDLSTHNLANAMWGLAAIMEFEKTHPELDDRDHWYNRPIKKIFLDIDGVLAAFEEQFFKYYPDIERNNLSPHDWADHRFTSRLQELRDNEEFWLSMPTLIDSKDICYPIAGYCTARSISEEWIKTWLQSNLFPDAQLLRVNFGESKVKKLKEAGCDIMIDDSINNFIELNSNGVTCFLNSRSHNLKYNVGYKRINDLKTFFENLQK